MQVHRVLFWIKTSTQSSSDIFPFSVKIIASNSISTLLNFQLIILYEKKIFSL